jgi:hypothetical protein
MEDNYGVLACVNNARRCAQGYEPKAQAKAYAALVAFWRGCNAVQKTAVNDLYEVSGCPNLKGQKTETRWIALNINETTFNQLRRAGRVIEDLTTGRYALHTDTATNWKGRHIGIRPLTQLQGSVDSVKAESGGLQVTGWTFDPDNTAVANNIQIYIGGEAGTRGATRLYSGTANQARADVKNTYPGIGDNHGFTAQVKTTLKGAQKVCVYAINVPNTPPVAPSRLLECKTVNLP